jgi:hypothetical protein
MAHDNKNIDKDFEVNRGPDDIYSKYTVQNLKNELKSDSYGSGGVYEDTKGKDVELPTGNAYLGNAGKGQEYTSSGDASDLTKANYENRGNTTKDGTNVTFFGTANRNVPLNQP